MSGDRPRLLPFYLVIDVSYSMDGEPLSAASDIMPTLVDAIAQHPALTGKVRFALIDFSDDARLLLPLCDLLDPNLTLPGLAARGATSYCAAFDLLRRQIEQDVRQLRAEGYAVHRPAVFFLSDGAPSDPDQQWRAAFHGLTHYDRRTGAGFAMYPNVIPFGVDQAEPRILRSLIHPPTGGRSMRMFLMDEGGNPADAIRSMAEILVSSVLSSGIGLAAGSSGVVLPDRLPAGVSAYAADDEDFL